MSDEIPSPRRAVEQRRNGPAPVGAGFDAVLFGTLRAQLARVERENAALLLKVAELNSTLAKARAWARTSNDNWKRRQQAWQRERAELLALVREHHAAGALDGALIGSRCPVCDVDRDGRQ